MHKSIASHALLKRRDCSTHQFEVVFFFAWTFTYFLLSMSVLLNRTSSRVSRYCLIRWIHTTRACFDIGKPIIENNLIRGRSKLINRKRLLEAKLPGIYIFFLKKKGRDYFSLIFIYQILFYQLIILFTQT